MSWNTIDPGIRTTAENVLTPKQLNVIRARANNHTWNTIALNMNLDEATVRGHYRRAIRKLAATRKDTT